MYILLTVACLLSVVQINALRLPLFFDSTEYNPCGTTAGLYFYPHPTDSHQYYHCDEYGIAYLQSCGALVWDELRLTCNRQSDVAMPPKNNPTSTPTTSSSSWPTPPPTTTLPSWPTAPPPTTSIAWVTPPTWTTATTTWTAATTTTSLPEVTLPTTTEATTLSVPSLCGPPDPCGEHGVCIESPPSASNAKRRFACICTENWFGVLCDKNIDELTTPSSKASDQSTIPSIKVNKDPSIIFYGLKANNFPESHFPSKPK